MSDNENYLLYTTIKNLLGRIEKHNSKNKAGKKINKLLKELRLAVDELVSSKKRCFDEIYDRQVKNLIEMGCPIDVIQDFNAMKSNVVGQLVETSIDGIFTEIPFILVIKKDVSNALLVNIRSKIKLVKSYIRYPRLIKNRWRVGANGPQVLLDIQFHDCNHFDSLKELLGYLDSKGRYCLTLSEFDYLFLHYPDTFGKFHCAGSYYENNGKIITISVLPNEAVVGALPDLSYGGRYYGMAISFAYKIY